MLKLLIVVLFILFKITVSTVYAVTTDDVPGYIPPKRHKIDFKGGEDYKTMIEHYAKKYSVKIEILMYVIKNESSFQADAVGDMNIICKQTGKPVRARGILQITECYYPHVTDDCAFDVQCSLETMLPIMADKKQCISQWTTCRNYYRM